MPKLNLRQRKFAAAYARLGNATQAAIEAGYSAKTAGQAGERLLKKAEIQAKLKNLFEPAQAEAIATAAERQMFFTQIMRGEGKFAGAELRDRMKAAELLGKMQGDFIERLEHKGGLEIEITRTIVHAKNEPGV